jgi:hypothetical protein
VPAPIAAVIDRMVARAPDDRPASAAEVLRLLRGEKGARREEHELPALGARAALRVAEAAVRAGRSVDLVGPHGSGRTRALRTLFEALTASGISVVSVSPGRRPFASLETIVGALDGDEVDGIEGALATVRARLREVLSDGTVVLADDAEQVDRWSAEVLSEATGAGRVVRAVLPEHADPGAEHVALEPLAEAELRPLFAGPERLFHIPSDAARALWRRTEGWPARVADEVNAWVRAGIARRDGERFVVDRESLDQLAVGQRLAPPLRGPMSARITLTPRAALALHLEELLVWLTLAWPHARVATLAAATRQPAWRLEAELRELERCRAARAQDDGSWAPVVLASPEAVWDAARRRAAHRALADALPVGADRRLVHLVASASEESGADEGLGAEIAREAIALAAVRASEGSLGQAIATLSEGLLAARRAGELCASELELLCAWAGYALEEGRPLALDRLLYEFTRCGDGDGAPGSEGAASVPRVRALIEAGLAVRTDSPRALQMAEAIAAFDDPELERCRCAVRMNAARAVDPERADVLLAEIERWAEGLPELASVRSSVAAWRGASAYRAGRFEDAARHHDEAAARATLASSRVAALCDSAAAWMEAFRFEECAEAAARAREAAAACRHAWREADAEWVLRTMGYRLGHAMAPDTDFVAAVGRLGVPDTEALAAITEAAIAWRSGDAALARSLARTARERWSGMGMRLGASFARSLEIASGAEVAEDERDTLAEWASTCTVPGIGVQALALLATRWVEQAAGWRAVGQGLAELVPREHWHVRQDVLSVEESLAALGAAG